MVEESSKGHVGRYVAGGHYDKQFIAQVIDEVLKGKPRRVVEIEYGINTTTLRRWLQDVDMAVSSIRASPRVTMELKRSVVRAVVSGRLSMREARIAYGVKSERTIQKWIQQLEQENADLVRLNEGSM